MARPKGPKDHVRRSKGWELFLSGLNKSIIAKELGVSRQAVGFWSREDRWDDRLRNLVDRADEVATHVQGNVVADSLIRLRSKLKVRLDQLETLCSEGQKPDTRLRAIMAWFKLAGIDRALPNPTQPTDSKSLQLIEDLLLEDDTDADVGTARSNHPGFAS